MELLHVLSSYLTERLPELGASRFLTCRARTKSAWMTSAALASLRSLRLFFFNDTAATEIYTSRKDPSSPRVKAAAISASASERTDRTSVASAGEVASATPAVVVALLSLIGPTPPRAGPPRECTTPGDDSCS